MQEFAVILFTLRRHEHVTTKEALRKKKKSGEIKGSGSSRSRTAVLPSEAAAAAADNQDCCPAAVFSPRKRKHAFDARSEGTEKVAGGGGKFAGQMEVEDFCYKLDQWAFIIFVLAFSLFNVVYAVYYC